MDISSYFDFITYFSLVFTPFNMAVLLLGVSGGLILGTTPGVSPTLAVALLIPFTFQMGATGGLILLGSVYSAAMAGGAISAILINVPGAPANIATLFDGHKMALKGHSMEALHYAFLASGVGGVVGVLVLIFLAPPLGELAMKFGPSEMFWVAVLGITVMGSVGSNSMVKGLFSGALGVWIATIGYNDTTGVVRYVFSPTLASGVSLVGALIGLFAIPEVLKLMAASRDPSGGTMYALEPRRVMDSIRALKKYWRSLSFGSVIGCFIGIIPGAGGQVAGLVSYDQCKKTSPFKKSYGTGEPDGVVASETANNATAGPALVPLLTLGVPGSPTAAVLLGGLLINGLFPGPELFSKGAPITWAFIDALLIAQILMVVLGLYLARISRRVAQIPKRFMAVAVLVLAVYGTYSVRNSFDDVIVMVGIGIFMYLIEKIGLTAGPLVLGIILGPIAETNWEQGRLIADATGGVFNYFFTGGFNLMLIGFCVLSIAYSIFSAFMGRREIALMNRREVS
jgi:putative tricarboxylic transport membrane protein